MKSNIMLIVKKRLAGIISTVMLLLSVPVSAFASQPTTPSGLAYDEIESEIEKLAESNSYVSFETAVYCKDEVLYQGCYGYADKENSIQADNNTVYEWGSISKTLIWISAMQLYEQGKLDLEEDIRTYLPEHFLRKLKYDEPITMLDLMNHQGGWQENIYTIQVNDRADICSLEEALKYSEPAQVFHPGEVTSYSNWGAALAGYIVERISGVSYCEYVHQNILEPLGMKHTSVAPDHSDNEWVKNQRDQLKSYRIVNSGNETIETPLGTNQWYINLYPAGAVTGTLSDLTTYAQAFVSEDTPLFKDKKTFDLLFSASSYYGDSDFACNRHGFWSDYYNVDTIYHDGGTNAGSSNMMFDIESGIGVLVLTNQPGESVFCFGIPELIFGDANNNPAFTKQNTTAGEDITGTYCQSRSVHKGILKLMSGLTILPLSKSSDDQYSVMGYYTMQPIADQLYRCSQPGISPFLGALRKDSDGNYQIHCGAMTLVQDKSLGIKLLMLAVYIFMAVVCLILLIIKLILRIIKKLNKYNGSYLIASSQIARLVSVLAILVMILLYSANMGLTHAQGLILSLTQLACLIIYLATAIISIKSMLKKSEKKAKTIKYIFAILSNFFSAAVILVFQLYYFWI